MPPSSKPLRILIADDHALVRVGLSSVLALENGIEIVAEASDGLEAVALYHQFRPDVALFDVRMPKMDGIEAVRRVCAEFPKAIILMLSTAELDEEVAQASEAGARGFITKNEDVPVVAAAIRRAAGGELIFSTEVMKRLSANRQLGPRELEVLAGMSKGRSNKEIAIALHLSEHTVKTYVKGVLSKLGAADRAGAVAVAFARGILKI
jgi:two-component system, NarL family, response regulator